MAGLFPQLNSTDNGAYNDRVVTIVQLPDGRYYRMWYDDYGQISALDLPTGGRIEWDYTRFGAETDGATVPYDYEAKNRVRSSSYTQSGVARSLGSRTDEGLR